MKLLIKFPIRGRQKKFFKLLDDLIEKQSGDNILQFLISADTDDEIINSHEVKSNLSIYDNLICFFSPRTNKIDAHNRDIDKVPDDWDILVSVEDDLAVRADNWDKYITAGMERYFPDTDGALWFYDGHKDDLNTYAILGNKYYKRTGYIYYSEYKSTWCDLDYQVVAETLGKIKKCDWPMVLFEHVRMDIMIDNVHIENQGYAGTDKSTFMRRKELYGWSTIYD